MVGPHPGPFSIRARGLGYHGFPVPVTLVEGREVTADVYLRPDPLSLEPLLVTAEQIRTELERRGFFRRMEKKHGFFMSPAYLKRRPPISVAEVIGRAPFVDIHRAWNGSQISMRVSGETCEPDIYVDDMPAAGLTLEEHVDFADIIAVEVFRGHAEIPQELALNQARICGLVMIWTTWSQRRSKKAGG